MEGVGAGGHAGNKFCKEIILLLKNKKILNKKAQKTAKVGLAPAHTVAEGRVKTGPLWSNLEPGYCDDPEGGAESRWLMLSQVRMSARAHTRARGLHLCGYRSQREPEGHQERPKESQGL